MKSGAIEKVNIFILNLKESLTKNLKLIKFLKQI